MTMLKKLGSALLVTLAFAGLASAQKWQALKSIDAQFALWAPWPCSPMARVIYDESKCPRRQVHWWN